MIKRISIENFRGLQKLEVDDAKRITLISGRNNVGKSSLLEGIFLYMDHTSPDSFSKLAGFRESIINGPMSLWSPLFYALNVDNTICIRIEDESEGILSYSKDENYLPYKVNGVSEEVLAQFRSATQESFSLFFRYQIGDYLEEGHFSTNGPGMMREVKTNRPGNELKILKPTQYLNSVFARQNDFVLNGIGNLELNGKKKDIIKYLKRLDPAIEDILTLSLQGITQLYIRINGQLIPLQYAGDGVMKLLNICIAILERKNGLVLIDELESGFHYSMYGKLWDIIDQVSKESNCQVVATTHSYEVIASVRNNLTETDDFAYYRLGEKGMGVKAYRYSYNMLEAALKSEMEVR